MRGLALAVLLFAAAGVQAVTPAEIPALQTKAQAGDAEAQFTLGEAYRTGRGVVPSVEMAIMWYRRAADQGHVRAGEELGFALFAHGDRQTAMPYIEQAAARGEPRAFYLLGTAHFNGDYATRDWPLAYAQTSRAASAGLSAAVKNLALMDKYLLPEDRAKAQQILATLPPVRKRMPDRPKPVVIASATPPGSKPVAATAPAVPLRPAAALASRSTPPPASAAPAPDAPTRTAAAVPTGAWRVQLGAFGSAARARDHWATLVAKLPRLSAYTQRIEAAGAVQRLQAMGLSGRADAAGLCTDVRRSGGDCLVIAP